MFKSKLWLFGLIAFFAFLPAFASAQVTYRLPRGETKEGTVVVSQPEAEIEGKITGDLFLFCQEAEISGIVEGDVFFLGSRLNVERGAEIYGSLFAVGQKAELAGQIRRNTYIFASELSTSTYFENRGDFNFAGKFVELNGTVRKKTRGWARTVNLKNVALLGDVFLKVRHLTYTPATVVKGTLTYVSPYEALFETEEPEAEAKISSMEWKKVPRPTFKQKFLRRLSGKLLSFLYLVVIGFLWVWLWKDKFKTAVLSLREKLWPALLWGVLVLLILPAVSVLLAFSILGVPVLVFLLAFLAFWAYLSPILVGTLLGQFLAQLAGYDWEKYPYLTVFVGLLILMILFALPGVGWIFKLATVILALGVLVVDRKEILGLKF